MLLDTIVYLLVLLLLFNRCLEWKDLKTITNMECIIDQVSIFHWNRDVVLVELFVLFHHKLTILLFFKSYFFKVLFHFKINWLTLSQCWKLFNCLFLTFLIYSFHLLKVNFNTSWRNLSCQNLFCASLTTYLTAFIYRLLKIRIVS